MTQLKIVPVNPMNTEFMRWASDLTEQLSSYNVPNPVSEDLWTVWASFICALPVIAELGVQNPSTFGSWREWASRLIQAIST